MTEETQIYLQELIHACETPLEEDDYIEHYGKAHDENPPGPGSGRYPFGSGERQHQHQWDVYTRYQKLKALGMKESDIAYALGFYKKDKDGNYILDENGKKQGNTTELRAEKQMATNQVKKDLYAEIQRYDESIDPDTGKHYTDTQIAKLMNLKGESSVRSIRKTGENGKQNKVTQVAEQLKKEVAEKGYIDVTRGAELYLNCSRDGLKTALAMLEKEGYSTQDYNLKQVSNPTQYTNFKVLCPPGSENDKPIFQHPQDIKMLTDPDPKNHNNDIEDFQTAKGLGDPPQISLDRIKIVYDEQGGTQRDGMIQIRAVRDENGNLVAANPDLSLGNAKYAQVRIGVEGNRYIKGMATYSDQIDSDIVVNSNKSIEGGVDKALKPYARNKDGSLANNVFGATVVPTIERDPKTGEPIRDKDGHQIRSAINIVGTNDGDAHVEGRWGKWSKNLPAQFLAKQSLPLVTQQLKLQTEASDDNLSDILKVNNPTVRRKLLIDYADQADRAACDLKAAPIGGQRTRVLLPVPSLKDNEVYCPGLPDGTQVALVRFPHAGPFEIPIATVNNRNKEALRFMKDAEDAVGINQHVANKLSGADFDGDTAIVIPMTRKNTQGEFEKVTSIKSAATLPHMDNFDPTDEYGVGNPRFSSMRTKGEDGKMHPTYPYFKTDKDKGKEMGVVSNLITDMYAKGCDEPEELSRAVRYSMVVIDAKKHELNYKQAEKDYGIQELKDKYQVNANGSHGVSSLMSRAKSPTQVAKRGMWRDTDIDPETGEKLYRINGKMVTTPDAYQMFENKSPDLPTTIKPETVRVPAPAGYKYTDKDGKQHSSKYMRDADGKFIEATRDGQVKQRADGSYYYDEGSGKKVWVREKLVPATEETYRMNTVSDARQLMSDNPSEIEKAYAMYANHEKANANRARKEALAIKDISYSPEAKKKYYREVEELDNALVKARMNSPRERQAQLLATSQINAIFSDRDDLDSDDRRKIRGQCLSDAREATGAKKDRITFTEKQWEAINAGAISPSKLNALLDNADKDSYMSLALPKQSRITDAKKERIKAYRAAGWSYEDIASAVDLSTSTVSTIANE